MSLHHRRASVTRLALPIVLLLASSLCPAQEKDRAGEKRPPSVVLFLADDLGYGDLGCFGDEPSVTPHLDALARGGLKATSYYSASPGCTAARAAILTGSYPRRVGLPGVLGPRSDVGLHPDETTLAELLKKRGHRTLMLGKWHLGHLKPFRPHRQGFDSWFGLPYSNDMSPDPRNNPRPRAAQANPPLPLFLNDKVLEVEPDQSLLLDRIGKRAETFISEVGEDPFFLYLPFHAPHVPLWPGKAFAGRTGRTTYTDVIAEIDATVGRVMKALGKAGRTRDTIVLFTSDNGPWLRFGDHGGSSGPLRNGKGTTFEGGMRVPLIVSWPGRIPAGSTSDELMAAMDLLPTLSRFTGAGRPEKTIDGLDLSAHWLEPKRQASPRDHFVYWWPGELQAVRDRRFKLHFAHGHRKVISTGSGGAVGVERTARIERSLFDLSTDIGERTSVLEKHPEVVRRLEAIAERWRERLGDRGRQGAEQRPVGR